MLNNEQKIAHKMGNGLSAEVINKEGKAIVNLQSPTGSWIVLQLFPGEETMLLNQPGTMEPCKGGTDILDEYRNIPSYRVDDNSTLIVDYSKSRNSFEIYYHTPELGANEVFWIEFQKENEKFYYEK